MRTFNKENIDEKSLKKWQFFKLICAILLITIQIISLMCISTTNTHIICNDYNAYEDKRIVSFSEVDTGEAVKMTGFFIGEAIKMGQKLFQTSICSIFSERESSNLVQYDTWSGLNRAELGAGDDAHPLLFVYDLFLILSYSFFGLVSLGFFISWTVVRNKIEYL